MPCDIPVGNGNLLITFDQDYCLRDLYYPSVGKENHTGGHRFRFGIWVDGQFDWVNKDWALRLEYAPAQSKKGSLNPPNPPWERGQV